MNNKEFKLIKNGYIFEYNYNFGHINVDNELTGECEDCIEVGMGIIFPDQQSFESKCNEWLRKRRGCIKIIFEKREFVFEFPFLHIISL